jgi:hypothetical protein
VAWLGILPLQGLEAPGPTDAGGKRIFAELSDLPKGETKNQRSFFRAQKTSK